MSLEVVSSLVNLVHLSSCMKHSDVMSIDIIYHKHTSLCCTSLTARDILLSLILTVGTG